MKQYINESELLKRAQEFANQYQTQQPFPFISFDNFFDPKDLDKGHSAIFLHNVR